MAKKKKQQQNEIPEAFIIPTNVLEAILSMLAQAPYIHVERPIKLLRTLQPVGGVKPKNELDETKEG